MDLEVENKKAVVTGGSKGIGLATVRALAAEGAHVVVGARAESPELEELCRGGRVTFLPVDLATASGARELVEAAVSVHGGVDILVNNVALSEPAGSVVDFTDDQWQRIFDTTFFSAVRTARAAVPHMEGRKGAAIVNISSLNAKLPAGMIAPYSAAKAALTNLSKALAEDLTPRGIRVNTVSPGPVRTPLWTGADGFAHLFAEQANTTVDDVMDRLLPETMAITTGRISEPEEVADLVLFLASNRSGNVTGADYVIDGGMFKSAA